MEQLDSLYSERLEYLLEKTDEISHNTDAWDSFVSGSITLITLFAAIVTIAGLIMLIGEIRQRRFTKERQGLVIKDLIRHLFVNAAIMEALEIKSQGKWNEVRPVEGVFSRFCFLESDFLLADIRIADNQFLRLHSLSVFLRNYNIAAEIAERNFAKPSVPIEEKAALFEDLWGRTERIITELIELLEDLWGRTERIITELIELGATAGLLAVTKKNPNSARQDVATFIKDYYKKEHENIVLPGGHPAPKDAFSGPDGQVGAFVIDIQEASPPGRLDPARLAVQEAEGPDAAYFLQTVEQFSAEHHAVLRPPFRRNPAGVADVFPIFRQRAAGRSRLVRTAQDGSRLAPEDDPAVHPVGKSVPVPVLAEGMDPVFPDEKSPQGFPPFEPEQFHSVPANDRFRAD